MKAEGEEKNHKGEGQHRHHYHIIIVTCSNSSQGSVRARLQSEAKEVEEEEEGGCTMEQFAERAATAAASSRIGKVPLLELLAVSNVHSPQPPFKEVD